MDLERALLELDAERTLVERDVAVGEWGRARRRTGLALERLCGVSRSFEPGLGEWVQLLGVLAAADGRSTTDRQMSLWPELVAPDRGDAAAVSAPDPTRHGTMGVITRDRQLREALGLLEQLSPTELPVLVEGESGTGKEVVARGVHAASMRGDRALVVVNCGAIPGELHESELFGHARGAYTGATMEKPGLFEAAHRGTLFLDEVGEMEPRAQVKLLRVLETGEMRRLGEVRIREVDVRVVAATNHDVDAAVAAGRFRKDLLFRLAALRITLPPLRERRADILPLAMHFLRKSVLRAPPLTPAARDALLGHDWPGNVRELKFVIERAGALWRRSSSAEITAEMLLLDRCLGSAPAAHSQSASRSSLDSPAANLPRLPRSASAPAGSARAAARGDGPPSQSDVALPPRWSGDLPAGCSLESFLAAVEERVIRSALERAGGNRTVAAQLLGGMSRTTLVGKIKRLGLAEAPSI